MGEHEGAGGWGFIRGGMGAISEAIAEIRPAPRHGDSHQCRGREGRGRRGPRDEGHHRDRRRVRSPRRRLQRELQSPVRPAGRSRENCRPNSSSTFAATGLSRRPSRSTSPRRRRRASPPSTRQPAASRRRTSPHRARRRLSAGSLRGRLPRTLFERRRSSRPSCRRLSTTHWRPRASTSSTCSAAMRRTSSRARLGRPSGRHS